VLICACLCTALSSCGAPGDIPLEYGKNVRKLGIFPVYPPREEFQIGDVYMWSQSKSDPNDSVYVYLDTIHDLRKRADDFMRTRIVFENTTIAEGRTTDVDVPAGSDGLVTRGELQASDNLARSLPIAAFPTVTADAGFTGSAVLARALWAVGLAGGSRTTVMLNFNDVRTYWVPISHVTSDVLSQLALIMANYSQAGDFERARMVRLRRGAVDPCRHGRICGVSVITRVYLTRQINYTYRNARIIAAALRSAEKGVPLSKSPTPPAVTVNVTAGESGQINASDMDAQMAELQAKVDTMTAGDTQGASFRFESWDARGVTFAQTYQRPVAVGWDGIELGRTQ
jgi:hypothetical protein